MSLRPEAYAARAVARDHLCDVSGCGVFGPYGFGPGGARHLPRVPDRWYCGEHREIGAAWWRAQLEGRECPRQMEHLQFSRQADPVPSRQGALL